MSSLGHCELDRAHDIRHLPDVWHDPDLALLERHRAFASRLRSTNAANLSEAAPALQLRVFERLRHTYLA